MSQHLASLEVGDTIDMRGPVGEFHYTGRGSFKIDGHNHNATCLNMVAGGTGITPCYQVADHILRDRDDPTKVSLIFACNDVNDLLCRSTLDRWAEEHPNRFKVTYVLARPTDPDWKGATGFVTKGMFEEVSVFSASWGVLADGRLISNAFFPILLLRSSGSTSTPPETTSGSCSAALPSCSSALALLHMGSWDTKRRGFSVFKSVRGSNATVF